MKTGKIYYNELKKLCKNNNIKPPKKSQFKTYKIDNAGTEDLMQGDIYKWVKDNEKKLGFKADDLLNKVMIIKQKEKGLQDFILDEDKLRKTKDFPFVTFNIGTRKIAAFGVYLARDIHKLNKNNEMEVIQKKFPVLVGDNNKYYEVTNKFKAEHKLNFSELPHSETYPYRWSLKSIKKWVTEQYNKINGMELYLKIKDQYSNYLYFISPEWYQIHALWDIGTYIYTSFNYYPIMEMRGVKGSAKTKLFTLSRMFTFNASEEMTNPTEATLFRETHELRGSIYIDEAEKLFTTIKGRIEADLRAEFINAGFKRTGTVPRNEQRGKKWYRVFYKAYGPKMVASINGLYGATEDRAITHVMTKVPATDNRGEKEPDENLEHWQNIRDELYIFTLQNWQQIKDLYDNFDLEIGLKSRDYNIWKGILVLAKYLDLDLYENILTFAKKLSAVKDADTIVEDSLQEKILLIARDLLRSNQLYQNAILVKHIRKNLDLEKKPHSKTIARILDGYGYKQYKKHTDSGWGYELDLATFTSIITPIFPSVMSVSSVVEEKQEIINDTNEIKMTKADTNQEILIKNSDANDANDETDDTIEPGRVSLFDEVKAKTSYKYTYASGARSFLTNKERVPFEDIHSFLKISYPDITHNEVEEALRHLAFKDYALENPANHWTLK